MTYQVLARKYRPQDFSSVVGQDAVVTALRNAITEDRLAQAYLFSGIRGVGKTSVARILAKALNCREREGADPCNACVACREITGGSDLDVIEVDAATYSKVEQVRELTESLRYGPARDQYKVVVIDEIHRLSRQAFDALLKIVEEPPEHLVFVFATTEAEAVPATVLSRCQEFRFGRVPAATLAAHLRQVCDGETIEASDAALRLVARAAEGSVRDAVALLDQLATFGSGAVADDDAARILGGVGAAVHHRLLAAMLAGDAADVSAVVGQLEQEGRDPRHVYAEFVSYCRDALHLRLGAEPAATDLPADDATRLAELAGGARYESLLRLLHLLLASEATVRRSEYAGLALEVAFLRAAELPRLTRIEELLAGAPPTAAPGGGGKSPRPAARSARRKAAAPEQQPRATPAPPEPPPAATPAPPEPPPTAAPAPPEPAVEPAAPPPAAEAGAPARRSPGAAQKPAPAAVAAASSDLEEFLQLVSRRRQPLAAHLADAVSIEFADGRLSVIAPTGDPWLPNALARPGNRKVFEECLRSVWGDEARWRLGEGAPAPATEPVAEAEPHPALEHPVVQAALDIFGGTAQAVDPQNGDPLRR